MKRMTQRNLAKRVIRNQQQCRTVEAYRIPEERILSFQGREQMETRYREVFQRERYAYNPTAWQYVDNEWTRL